MAVPYRFAPPRVDTRSPRGSEPILGVSRFGSSLHSRHFHANFGFGTSAIRCKIAHAAVQYGVPTRCRVRVRRHRTAEDSSGMPSTHEYAATEPSRPEIDALAGPTLLEFGSPWCGHCRRAQPFIDEAFASHAGVRHIKVADASQRPLGRSFAVKLWPTLVFLKDGREVARLVRPRGAEAVRKALAEIDR